MHLTCRSAASGANVPAQRSVELVVLMACGNISLGQYAVINHNTVKFIYGYIVRAVELAEHLMHELLACRLIHAGCRESVIIFLEQRLYLVARHSNGASSSGHRIIVILADIRHARLIHHLLEMNDVLSEGRKLSGDGLSLRGINHAGCLVTVILLNFKLVLIDKLLEQGVVRLNRMQERTVHAEVFRQCYVVLEYGFLDTVLAEFRTVAGHQLED